MAIAKGDGESVARQRRLPSVDKALNSPLGQSLVEQYGRQATVSAIRHMVNEARSDPRRDPSIDGIIKACAVLLEGEQAPRLKSVFNLTGTVLHTNLGRAQIAEAAIGAAVDAMRNAVALEFDVEQGGRGERDNIVRDLLCELTGAEDATLVNNNAAAVLIALNTFSNGRDAIVSRGELIEIGGAFRMPEIMNRAGARLKEVGTTNRTHKRDYENALTDESGLLLKVHTSNYRIEGFTSDVPAADLVDLAQAHNVPLVDDLGSGTLIDLTRFGLPYEPTVAQAVAAGADIVTFSGDKLLGGPQAGFLVGRKDLIAQINANPMKRALRVDKIRLAAIEATLRLYRDPDRLVETLPTYRFLSRRVGEIKAMATRLAPHVSRMLGGAFDVGVVDCASQVGSGAMPVETLDSAALTIKSIGTSGAALQDLADKMRLLDKPVIGRITNQALLLDVRCLESEEDFIANLEGFADVNAGQ